jgi:subtilase family serine protease
MKDILSSSHRPHWTAGALAALGVLVASAAGAAPTIRVGSQVTAAGAQAPTTSSCLATLGVPCYNPQQIRNAYNLTSLLDAGYQGTGQTIVLIESYGSPTLAADLAQFDADFGLPAPPSLRVLVPLGTAPVDLTQPDQQNWAFETTLDVDWAHAMAPGAAIVVLTSPVDETIGVQGLPEFLQLEQYALDHHLGQILSQSWATTENTLFAAAAGPQGPQVIENFTAFYQRARAEHVTVLGSTGDSGSQNAETFSTTLGAPTSFYTFPTVNFPSSSPLVTAVGGTTLRLDASGNYQSETVWDDVSTNAGAGGGGISQLFQTPDYQLLTLPPAARPELDGHRGVPDVAYNADDENSAILIYASFLSQVDGPASVGYYLIGGTSEGAPQWAGIVADLNQFGHAALGFLNPKLYALGELGLFPKFGHDITQDNNGYGGVPGYNATVGWDPASGWGTPDLSQIQAHWSQFIQAQ